MRNKLQPWKGKHLSSGGRLILTNSSLCSMPTYTMGMFLLQDRVHKQMDTIRSQFFWRGTARSSNTTWWSGRMSAYQKILEGLGSQIPGFLTNPSWWNGCGDYMLAQRTTSAVNSLNKNILKGNQSSAKKETEVHNSKNMIRPPFF